MEQPGTVLVQEVSTGITVAHFRAHKAPLTLLRLGGARQRLLLTGCEGGGLNVYRVSSQGVLHLYRLQKGLSSRSVAVSADFSACGTWLALCTDSCTTHLFGISPQGGVV